MEWEIKSQSIGLLITDADIAVRDHCRAHLVGHIARLLVADPCVNTTTTREYPKQVCEVEILRHGVLDDTHGNLEVSEASLTHIGALAARPHIIIVVHIDIEHHLFLQGDECALI